MKDFEERYTAWIDGRLEGAERTAFERELEERHPEAGRERAEAGRLGELLRAHGGAAPLPNPEFFNHQVLEEIRRGGAREERPVRFPSFRLAWLGALCVAGAAALFSLLIPQGPYFSEPSNPALARVLEAVPGDEGVSVTTFRSRRGDVTVVWLDGLEYVPSTESVRQ